MKKLIFTVLLMSSVCLSAQKYVSFPTENAEWNVVLYTSPEEFPAAIESKLLNYFLEGDSLLNNISYKKLYVKTSTATMFSGLIREEGKKIFYIGAGYTNFRTAFSLPMMQKVRNCLSSYSQNSDQEFLLYDFNVSEGDAIHWGYESDIIDKIDSVQVDGIFRKRYVTRWRKDIIVEGIGNVVRGLLSSVTPVPMCGGSMWWDAICFSQNGKTLYFNPKYRECGSIEKWNDRNYLKVNTQWYYGETIYLIPNNSDVKSYDYNSLKSVGDTLINGKACNKISRVRGIAGCVDIGRTMYLYQSNDTTYFYNVKSNKFSPLNVYGANKGDFWNVEYPAGNVQVVVDSVGSVQGFGRNLKVQYVTYKASLSEGMYIFEHKSRIIEGVGDVNYLFMSNIFSLPVCDEMGGVRTGLRCYVHPDYGTYSQSELSCDYISSVVSPNYNSMKVNISDKGSLKIEGGLLTETCTFELLDVRGIVLISTEVNQNKCIVDVAKYGKGLYLYRLTSNGKLLKAGKVLKN